MQPIVVRISQHFRLSMIRYHQCLSKLEYLSERLNLMASARPGDNVLLLIVCAYVVAGSTALMWAGSRCFEGFEKSLPRFLLLFVSSHVPRWVLAD